MIIITTIYIRSLIHLTKTHLDDKDLKTIMVMIN